MILKSPENRRIQLRLAKLAILAKIALGLTFCSLLLSCSMAPKFDQLLLPPAGKAAVYIYRDDHPDSGKVAGQRYKSSVNELSGALVPRYQFNHDDKLRLAEGTSHLYMVEPGRQQLKRFLPHGKSHKYQFDAQPDDVIFVEFTLQEKNVGGAISFARAVSIFKQGVHTEAAIEDLQATRLEIFWLLADNNAASAAPAPKLDSSPPRAIQPPAGLTSRPAKDASNTDDIVPATGETALQTESLHSQALAAEQSSQRSIQLDVAPSRREKSAAATHPTTETDTPAGESVSVDPEPRQQNTYRQYLEDEGDRAWQFDRLPLSRVSCTKPYLFTRDCRRGVIADRAITIDNTRLLIAGSSNGKNVLVMARSSLGSGLREFFSFGIAEHPASKSIRRSAEVLESFMATQGIEVKKRQPIIRSSDVVGYILTLSDAGYTLIDEQFGAP